jgi:hypothetical protein
LEKLHGESNELPLLVHLILTHVGIDAADLIQHRHLPLDLAEDGIFDRFNDEVQRFHLVGIPEMATADILALALDFLPVQDGLVDSWKEFGCLEARPSIVGSKVSMFGHISIPQKEHTDIPLASACRYSTGHLSINLYWLDPVAI